MNNSDVPSDPTTPRPPGSIAQAPLLSRGAQPWSRLLVVCCTVFILTIFLMLSSAFNGRPVEMARFFDRHGLSLLGAEVGAFLVLAFLMMRSERRATLRRIREFEQALLENRPAGNLDERLRQS